MYISHALIFILLHRSCGKILWGSLGQVLHTTGIYERPKELQLSTHCVDLALRLVDTYFLCASLGAWCRTRT